VWCRLRGSVRVIALTLIVIAAADLSTAYCDLHDLTAAKSGVVVLSASVVSAQCDLDGCLCCESFLRPRTAPKHVLPTARIIHVVERIQLLAAQPSSLDHPPRIA
jgi:hypothetical protein